MILDPDVCERARLSRDARFDGRFFVGVLTTGIYCRPICPVRPPHPENVRFFPTAAAAWEAGLRPCLRCRPETAPSSAAWLGSSATLRRALRLIEAGALDSAGVEALAERLGVGARHLRRLFTKHLGASPTAVAQTRRLHLAKQLLTETDLPMTEVALAAGFGSVRRFHSMIKSVYARSPTELRRSRPSPGADGIRLKLAYRPPFDWDALLAFLRPRAIPGVEVVGNGTYRRTIAMHGKSGVLSATSLDGEHSLCLEVHFPDASALGQIVARARRLFDLDADPAAIDRVLARDPTLAPLVRARPGTRVPGCWDGFELAVRVVLGQQVSVAAATTLAGRVVRQYGRPAPGVQAEPCRLFPEPERLRCAPLEALGLPARRAASVRDLAGRFCRGELSLDGSEAGEVERLRSVPGIGDWTAEYMLMRAFCDPDAFPASDLGLRRVMGKIAPLAAKDLLASAEPWRPWRAYAAMHLWQDSRSRPSNARLSAS